MKVVCLHHTPLWICAKATRTCWASEGRSDSDAAECDSEIGPKDAELIDRIGNKYKHESVKNHINYVFEVEGISTKTLLALTRHDIGTEFSVQSTRYTTSKRRDQLDYTLTRNDWVNEQLAKWFETIKEGIDKGISDDDLAMMLPQAYHYKLVMTMSMGALSHFLKLRLKKDAHYDIQLLAILLSDAIPEEHRFMFPHAVQ